MKIRALLERLGLVKRQPRPVARFASIIGNFAVSKATVVKEAKDLSVRADWMRTQLESGNKPVAHCPGMWDYYQCGFIIPAHCDIHIAGNKEEIQVSLSGLQKLDDPDLPKLMPVKFDYRLVEGNAPIQDSVKTGVEKVPLPWAIFLEEGWSAYVIPAIMHSSFLDKIHIYPGLVDYDNFTTCNFIFSVLKECDFTIYAGEPLLHVIPFRREEVTASCGRATQEELDKHQYSFPSRKKGFYRNFLHQKKVFKMGCPFHSSAKKEENPA
jgi:hypothetical protein